VGKARIRRRNGPRRLRSTERLTGTSWSTERRQTVVGSEKRGERGTKSEHQLSYIDAEGEEENGKNATSARRQREETNLQSSLRVILTRSSLSGFRCARSRSLTNVDASGLLDGDFAFS
jgi:hypothetical protein